MTRKTLAVTLTFLLAACAQKASSDEAIRKALLEYLASRPGLDMSKMDVTIGPISTKDDNAETTVKFQVKGGTAAQSMEMKYALRRIERVWTVQSNPAGHAGMGVAQGEGSADKAGAGAGFHPDVAKQ